jgi:hypothetical protein
MFTDWTMVDPHYFYFRGALWGFVVAMLLSHVVFPFIRNWK